MIVDETRAVTLVGGGPLEPDDLALALALAPVAVALDKGADACLAAGITPRAVIGDLDSLSDRARAAFADRLHHVDEQVTTDFDKGMRHVAAPLVIGAGLMAGRMDHTLAALSTLMRHADRPCLLLGPQSLVFHCPPRLTLDLPGGMPVSLYPLAPGRVESRGLVWPTGGLLFEAGGRLGTSNAATGGAAVLAPGGRGMLVILPRAALAVAAGALGAAPCWPPVPRGG